MRRPQARRALTRRSRSATRSWTVCAANCRASMSRFSPSARGSLRSVKWRQTRPRFRRCGTRRAKPAERRFASSLCLARGGPDSQEYHTNPSGLALPVGRRNSDTVRETVDLQADRVCAPYGVPAPLSRHRRRRRRRRARYRREADHHHDIPEPAVVAWPAGGPPRSARRRAALVGRAGRSLTTPSGPSNPRQVVSTAWSGPGKRPSLDSCH
jgi:hypothetical protein